jgi:hypothetical protein
MRRESIYNPYMATKSTGMHPFGSASGGTHNIGARRLERLHISVGHATSQLLSVLTKTG